MRLMDSRAGFGRVTRVTHAAVIAVVVVQLCLGWLRGTFPHGSALRSFVLVLHESFGLTLLAVAVFFVLWALVINRRPEHDDIKGWQRKLSLWVHWALFGLIVLEPALGLSLVELGGHAVSFFGVAHIPPVLGTHKEIGELLGDVHGFIAWCILVLGGFHALAALYHHLIERDSVLVGMLPWGD